MRHSFYHTLLRLGVDQAKTILSESKNKPGTNDTKTIKPKETNQPKTTPAQSKKKEKITKTTPIQSEDKPNELEDDQREKHLDLLDDEILSVDIKKNIDTEEE